MRFFPVFAFTDGDRWRPGIGDPTFMGWLTVVAYAFAAILCLREAMREREMQPRFLFWGVLGTLMVLLGVNKQLDLQTWFTLTGRKIAVAHGWYGKRRLVQFLFILFLIFTAAASFGAVWRLVQEFGSDLWLPLAGLFVILCFVIIRAASFHHFDEFLRLRLAGFKMNWLLELGGIGIIITGAIRHQKASAESFSEA